MLEITNRTTTEMQVQHRPVPGDLPPPHGGHDALLPPDGIPPVARRHLHHHLQHDRPPGTHQEQAEQEEGESESVLFP